jgi:hypothetical protein
LGTINFVLTLLAVLTSIACTVLLFRAYSRSGVRLLFWSALAFVCLSANNILLFVDLIVLPDIDLRMYRLMASFVGVLFLIYGFIWEAE